MKNYLKPEAAYSLFEMLVALTIATPILYGVFQLFITQLRHNVKIGLVVSEELAQQKFATYLYRALLDYDSHSFAHSPRIHSAGQIRFIDGSNNPVLSSSTSVPHTHADALTVFAIKTDEIYLLQTKELLSNQLKLNACNNQTVTDPISLHNTINFIGVGVDGIIELQNTDLTRSVTAKTCISGTFSATTKSMSFNQTLSLDSIRMIVPLTKHYTLFVDQTHQLRYLSHQGAMNIENQPLLQALPLYILSSSYNHNQNYQIQVTFTHPLPRLQRIYKLQSHLAHYPALLFSLAL